MPLIKYCKLSLQLEVIGKPMFSIERLTADMMLIMKFAEEYFHLPSVP